MDYLSKLENDSIYIIREAYSRFRRLALLWSMGKDSTTLLWLCRKAFLGEIPIPVLHLDTSYKFQEIYQFRDEYAKKWGLNLIVERNENALKEGMNFEKGHLECCHALKTEALRTSIMKNDFDALLLAIRRDEHGVRAKERFFSPRDKDFQWNYKNQPPELWDMYHAQMESDRHFRIHPVLSWREIDIWNYIQREKIPVNPLYFAKKDYRYRSIGCETCCMPVPSKANNIPKIVKELETTQVSERSGRAQDKEDDYAMQKLRSLGYM